MSHKTLEQRKAAKARHQIKKAERQAKIEGRVTWEVQSPDRTVLISGETSWASVPLAVRSARSMLAALDEDADDGDANDESFSISGRLERPTPVEDHDWHLADKIVRAPARKVD